MRTQGAFSRINEYSPIYGDEDADQPLNRVLPFQDKYFFGQCLRRAVALGNGVVRRWRVVTNDATFGCRTDHVVR
jgi:hypothetical protein